ncbi:MAG: response regulator [Helicobacteraceae bacterium]|jgi:two-component system chemotaxis response regulator CheY|nr:response regulator [Helicobacteraceae bacterium]
MAIVKRNLRVGRRILECAYVGADKIVLVAESNNSCVVKILKAEDQSAVADFKIDLAPRSDGDFIAIDDYIFVNNYRDLMAERHTISDRVAPPLGFNYAAYHASGVSAFAAAKDATAFALGDPKGNITIWSEKSKTPTAIVKGFPPLAKLEFDADGQRIAAAFESGLLMLIAAENINAREILELHTARVTALAFVGKMLISGDISGKIAIWDGDSRRPLRVYPLNAGAITGIVAAFERKAAIVTSANGAFVCVDLTRNQAPIAVDNLTQNLFGVSFNENYKQLFVYTDTWNLLFYHLRGDKSIEEYLALGDETGAQKTSKLRMKAIVVDDSITMRKVISSAIKEEFDFIDVLEAGNGKEALDLLQQNYDVKVMFLDWNMPTLSGEDVVRKIKELRTYPNLQVIMATTEGGQEKVKQMLKMGVAGYLVKPFRRDAVVKIMQKLTENM